MNLVNVSSQQESDDTTTSIGSPGSSPTTINPSLSNTLRLRFNKQGFEMLQQYCIIRGKELGNYCSCTLSELTTKNPKQIFNTISSALDKDNTLLSLGNDFKILLPYYLGRVHEFKKTLNKVTATIKYNKDKDEDRIHMLFFNDFISLKSKLNLTISTSSGVADDLFILQIMVHCTKCFKMELNSKNFTQVLSDFLNWHKQKNDLIQSPSALATEVRSEEIFPLIQLQPLLTPPPFIPPSFTPPTPPSFTLEPKIKHLNFPQEPFFVKLKVFGEIGERTLHPMIPIAISVPPFEKDRFGTLFRDIYFIAPIINHPCEISIWLGGDNTISKIGTFEYRYDIPIFDFRFQTQPDFPFQRIENAGYETPRMKTSPMVINSISNVIRPIEAIFGNGGLPLYEESMAFNLKDLPFEANFCNLKSESSSSSELLLGGKSVVGDHDDQAYDLIKGLKNLDLSNHPSCSSGSQGSTKIYQMLKEIQVVQLDSDDPPPDAVKEWDGWSADINRGFNGKYVYLVPVYTTTQSEAASSIEVSVHHCGIDGKEDLATETGGKFRHIFCLYGGAEKIGNDVQLWRTKKSDSLPSREGYRFSGDINAGRGGDYLYVCWKMIQKGN